MGKQIFDVTKKILSIFVVIFFVVSVTFVAVLSLACDEGREFTNKIFFQK